MVKKYIEERVCSKCLLSKPLTKKFFRVTKEYRTGKEYFRRGCYACELEYISKSNKAKWEIKKRELHILRQELVDYAGGKCAHCNCVFHWSVYDFHHIDPSTKVSNVSTMLSHYSYNLPAVYLEIDKCLLLCANCHRLHHWGGSNSHN